MLVLQQSLLIECSTVIWKPINSHKVAQTCERNDTVNRRKSETEARNKSEISPTELILNLDNIHSFIHSFIKRTYMAPLRDKLLRGATAMDCQALMVFLVRKAVLPDL